MKIIQKNKKKKFGDKPKSKASDVAPMRTSLPPVGVLEITELNEDGELFAKPVIWDNERREPPRILLVAGTRGQSPAVGQRVLAKMLPGAKKYYTAEVIRVLPEKAAAQVLGVFSPLQKGGLLQPVNRKQKHDFLLPIDQCDGLKTGDLILAELQPRRRDQKMGLQEVTVVEVLGDINSPRCFSLIATFHHEIPTMFSEAALAEAENAEPPTLAVIPAKAGISGHEQETPAFAGVTAMREGRVDLRQIPLITIDGQDARDFDDAVFAEKDGDGWHLIVAIADVAHYVKPGSPLDQEALNRGNSVYFPDRVVPMLPEALSNGLCSLKPNEDRYCLAVHLWIDTQGFLKKYEFVRAIMQSHARTTYEQIQQLWNDKDEEWMPFLEPLYGAYRSLLEFREERGALELDLPEFSIKIGDDGKVAEVRKRERMDSHKLIEEFMICANVAAAEAIEEHKTDGIFRIHESPNANKVEELRSFLKTMDYSLAQNAAAKQFNKLITKAEGTPEATLISSAILRSQMQAYYSPRNKGHFGLGLEKYCHFTSPIRRYADLVVHRALIEMLGLQERGEKRLKHAEKEVQENIASIADHISQTERRAMLAEREANDRYITAYMANHLRAEFEGYITSVGSFGLFVTLTETGATGILRMADLGRDFFMYDERAHSLKGRDFGQRYQLGQRVTVMVQQADVALGTMRFSLLRAEKLPQPVNKPTHKSAGKFSKKQFEGKGKFRKEEDRKPEKIIYSEIPDPEIIRRAEAREQERDQKGNKRPPTSKKPGAGTFGDKPGKPRFKKAEGGGGKKFGPKKGGKPEGRKFSPGKKK